MPGVAINTCINMGQPERLEMPQEKSARPAPHEPEWHADGMAELMALVHRRTGIDFSGYRPATLHRRIGRRMSMRGIPHFNQYLALARSTEEELDLLYRDILISVTCFFRDEQAFHALGKRIEKIVRYRGPQDQIRVWIAGCASGEEAYSIGMLFAEAMGGPEKIADYNCQIFGTDINSGALNAARRALYAQASLKYISPERRRRFFTRHGDRYEIIRPLREMVLFARHNVIEDPPFLRMDLVSCRNVLIYLNNELQQRVLKTMHYSLQPEGCLLLGKSEAPGMAAPLFQTANAKAKLYTRKQSAWDQA